MCLPFYSINQLKISSKTKELKSSREKDQEHKHHYKLQEVIHQMKMKILL